MAAAEPMPLAVMVLVVVDISAFVGLLVGLILWR